MSEGHLHSSPGYAGHKGALSARMKRIEGQVRGIERMIADDTYCIDVLTQVSAITKALQSVSLALLDDHLGHCVVEAAAAGITLTPTTVFRRKGDASLNVRFAGLMSGYEFSTLLETILLVGGERELSGLEAVAAVDVPVRMRTFVTPTCPYCPRAVLTAFRFALSNPNITGEGIEANEFPTLSSGYRISGVPDTVIEGAAGVEGVRAARVLGAQPEPAFVEALTQAVGEAGPAAG